VLIKIEISRGRRRVRILFGLLEELIELPFQNTAVGFVSLDLLAKHLVAAAGFALEFGYRSGQVLDHGRLLGNRVRDDGTGFRIDLEAGTTAGTLDLKQSWGHVSMITLACHADVHVHLRGHASPKRRIVRILRKSGGI
jgi:hypothetical protein